MMPIVNVLTSRSIDNVYTLEESEFLKAMDRYKTLNRRPFPTFQKVLAVVRSLGYRRVADPVPLPMLARHSNGSGDVICLEESTT